MFFVYKQVLKTRNVVVENGVVESIQITEPGAGYVEAPKVIIHSGGWRKLGAGNSPFSDLSGTCRCRNFAFKK